MFKKLKKTNGITLIALIITVIVLLILAGISISLVVGDNGVLTQASSSVVTNREAKAKEEVKLAWASAETKYFTDWAQNTSVVKDDYYGDVELLTSYVVDTGEITSSTPNGDGSWTVKYVAKDQNKTYTFIIDESGNVETKAGISLDKESIELQIINGTPSQKVLTATVEGLDGTISWKVEGEESAKVNLVESGDKKTATLTGVSATTGTVRVVARCGNEEAKCTVRVIEVVSVTSVSLSAENTTVNRGNSQTITATVNAGATERLNWSVNEAYRESVTIGEPVVNTGNNTQTVEVTITNQAPAGTLIVTAQNEEGNLTNNTINITVNVPVEGISITPTAAITIAPGGYVDLTGTVNADATEKGITWTIENPSVANLVSLPSTTSTTSGGAIRVTAGQNEGTVTIRARAVGDNTVTATKVITVGEEPEFGEADAALKEHFGKTVLTSSDITYGAAGWQLFYADSEKIYLIYADYLENGKIPSGTSISKSGYSVYATGGSSRDILINYLKTESNWTSVSNVFNTKYNVTGIKAKGAPTPEMWMASYNARYGTNLGAKNFKNLSSTNTQVYYKSNESTGALTNNKSTTSIPGYLYTRNNEGSSTKWESYLPYQYMNTLSGYPTGGANMYYPHTSTVSASSTTTYGHWLARSFC